MPQRQAKLVELMWACNTIAQEAELSLHYVLLLFSCMAETVVDLQQSVFP